MARQRTVQNGWHTATNPDVLLNIVWPRPLAYDAHTATRDLPPPIVRRLRLFGVACARMIWDILSNDARNAVVLSERYADGLATQADLRAARVRMVTGPVTFQQQASNAAGWASTGYVGPTGGGRNFVWNPIEAAREAARALATQAVGALHAGSPDAEDHQTVWDLAFHAARAHQAELVRDIFPPPTQALQVRRLDPSWLTFTVLSLARQTDETGEYSALPILADALQDAGCDNQLILDRCRIPSGIHSRGNWVVDLLLGRE